MSPAFVCSNRQYAQTQIASMHRAGVYFTCSAGPFSLWHTLAGTRLPPLQHCNCLVVALHHTLHMCLTLYQTSKHTRLQVFDVPAVAAISGQLPKPLKAAAPSSSGLRPQQALHCKPSMAAAACHVLRARWWLSTWTAADRRASLQSLVRAFVMWQQHWSYCKGDGAAAR
jgi:hypothetical protein